MSKNTVELKVSSITIPNKLGGAIAKYLGEVDCVVLRAMGEKPVNQAVKGVIAAQSFLSAEAKDIQIKLGFRTKYDEELGKDMTYIVFSLTLQ